MKNLKGRCVFAQSGGPTTVINASIAGGLLEALENESVTGVLCAHHGIKGVLDEDFFDISLEDKAELEALKHTPSSAFGSVRYKLKNPAEDDSDYRRILEVFKKYDVRYFFYNGGNDSMDTCDKISKYMQKSGYDMNVIGIPKTIDNDLCGTDHCPGYGSAAKYIANSIMEINRDASIYPSPLVVVVEIMGRNAGWLTAASKLASINGFGADLIYLPETPFSYEKFLSDVKAVADAKNYCVVAVSEGIRFENGKYVGEDQSSTDVFGHSQLGGVCSILKAKVKTLGLKCKAVELNILQRCAAHCASDTDIEESFTAGRQAVKKAVDGETDKMIAFRRKPGETYEIDYVAEPLSSAANAEKRIPAEWITADGTNLTDDFVAYALPLINGEPKRRLKNGLPVYAKLKLKKFKI
ncbi:MAG: 6-phosphofructokinase [Candidatus Borkfalkiaceae bacterium]|nr:6-phosphofructokinase [Christensenellaceae bacterium]